MEARLEYLVDDANDQPISKIKPECPYKADWIRNRGDNPCFKALRELYDETYSSYKGKSKTKNHSQSTTRLGAISKNQGTNQRQMQNKQIHNTLKNTGGHTEVSQGQAELDIDTPVAVNIKPTEVLRIFDEVLKLGLEASQLQQVNLVWEQLGKISNQQNPALKPVLLMDVFKKTLHQSIWGLAIFNPNRQW